MNTRLNSLLTNRRNALQDVNVFLETMFSRPGKPHVQASLHREGQEWLSTHLQAMLCWPRDHGKTTQIAGRALWAIGRNPGIRIKYLCESDDIAYQRSRFIRNQVCTPIFRWLFPHVRPGDPWGDVSWSVEHERPVIDPTFHALGVGTSATGGRADLIIADDLVGFKALRSKKERERGRQYWKNQILNLLEPDGAIWIIYTPWHADDLNTELEKTMPCLRRPIGPNFEPVWPEHWPEHALMNRRLAIGLPAWTRGYWLRPIAEGDVIVPADCLHYREPARRYNRVILGVDVAVKDIETADRSAIAVIGEHADRRLDIVDCWAGRTTTPKLVAILASLAELHQPAVIAVEQSAMQSGIWDLAAQHAALTPWAGRIRHVSHSKSKVSRLEAASPHFESGLIALAANGSQGINDLVEELTTAPLGDHDDTWDAALTGIEYAMTTRKAEIR